MFTATVTLDADFDDDNDTDRKLSGSITDFVASNSPSSDDWILVLKEATLTGNTQVSGGMIEEDSTSEIGEVPVSGNWNARVYGVDNHLSIDDDTDLPTGLKCDSAGCAADVAGVAGWFNARGNDIPGVAVGVSAPAVVAIGGAFGAK